MTRLEALQDPERAAEILCDMIQDAFYNAERKTDTMWNIHHCDCCPASKWCDYGSNGFLGWLAEEDDD